MLGQRWGALRENLNSHQQDRGFNTWKKKGTLPCGLTVATPFESHEQVGRIISTSFSCLRITTQTMTGSQLKLLRSENRFLSVTLPNLQNEKSERKAARRKVQEHVQQHAGDGLTGAIWYGFAEFIVGYETRAQRDRALRTISEDSLTLALKGVQPIGPGGPKLHMSWIVDYHPKDTPAALSSALHRHFGGTGYRSSYSFGQYDQPKNMLRIVFHNAPPFMDDKLRFGLSPRKKLRRQVVTSDDYSLCKEQTPTEGGALAAHDIKKEMKAEADINAAKNPSFEIGERSEPSAAEDADGEKIFGSALRKETSSETSDDLARRARTFGRKSHTKLCSVPLIARSVHENPSSPASGLHSEQPSKAARTSPGNMDIRPQLLRHSSDIANQQQPGIVSPGGPLQEKPRDFDVEDRDPDQDISVMDQRSRLSEQYLGEASQQYVVPVLIDDTSYVIPTSVALALDTTTFDTFARLYLNVSRQIPETLNAKTLIRLYRAFLETQFPDDSNETIMEALQRVSY